MNIADLNIDLLTDEEKFFLIMHGIDDLTKTRQEETKNTDMIIVLGCTPIPLRARVLKMMELVKMGASKNIMLSGGRGWTKLLKTPEKKEELLKAIRDTINADLLGDNPTEKELALHERFNEGMRAMGLEDHVHTYSEEQEKKKLKMTESEFMRLIILTNGGLRGVKFFHEPFSYTTRENMLYTNEVIKSGLESGELEKADKLLIVTSAFHCRRALLTFKKMFPNAQIVVCPATKDMEDRGIELGRQMLENDYYKQQIRNECSAIINYSGNGSIANMSLEEMLIRADMTENEKAETIKMIRSIEKHQIEVEK